MKTIEEIKVEISNRKSLTKENQEKFLDAFYKAVAEPLKYRVVLFTDIPNPQDPTEPMEILVDRSWGNGDLIRDGWQISDDASGEYFFRYGLTEKEVIDTVNELCSTNGLCDAMSDRLPMPEEQLRLREEESAPLPALWYRVVRVELYPY